jgi:hypothetical protein
VATSGAIQWPPTGSFPWPPSTSAPGMDPLIVLFVFLPPLIHAAVWFLDPGFTGLCSRDRDAGRGIVSAALRSRRRVYRNCEDRLSGARPGYAQLW